MPTYKLETIPYIVSCTKTRKFSGTLQGNKSYIEVKANEKYLAARRDDGGIVVFNTTMSIPFGPGRVEGFTILGKHEFWKKAIEKHNISCGKRILITYE